MSVVSFLGGYSAILILSDEENIQVDTANVDYYINFTDIDNAYFIMPYQFKNVGYFDLEDLEVDVTIYVNFRDTRKDKNESTAITILESVKEFDTIKEGETEKDEIEFDSDDFKDDLSKTNETIYTNWDLTDSPDLWYTLDLKISAKYSLGLLSFRTELYEIKIGEEEVM